MAPLVVSWSAATEKSESSLSDGGQSRGLLAESVATERNYGRVLSKLQAWLAHGALAHSPTGTQSKAVADKSESSLSHGANEFAVRCSSLL